MTIRRLVGRKTGRGRGVNIECTICKKEFYVGPKASVTAKYCSSACMHKGKIYLIEKICEYCGKLFKKRDYRRKYCSIKCVNKSKKGLTGCKSHRWQGGISKGHKAGYWKAEYRNWREAIFKRDNYTCQYCKKKGIFIHAHHIFRFAYFPQFRYEKWNGITLCKDCHRGTQKWDLKLKLISLV